jgi:MarR family transcriptional regulator for hemolysin
MQTNLERDPLVVLSDVARQMRTLADARAREHGMTRAQWMILVRLERQPGMSQNELATLVEVEPITVGRLVDRLETRGMVERRPDPGDRRIWRLHVTPNAEPMLREIYQARAELNAIMTANIPSKTLENTIDCLLQMKTNMTDTRANAKSA